MGCQFKGMPGTLHFFTVVGAVHDLIRTERTRHAYVGFVTENIIGLSQLGLDRRHHELGSTRP
ncbi:hypothetical protein D3C85_1836300 [compost metagenome]